VAPEAIWKSPQHLSSGFGVCQTLAVLGCGCSHRVAFAAKMNSSEIHFISHEKVHGSVAQSPCKSSGKGSGKH
jgi:hypothetical protein